MQLCPVAVAVGLTDQILNQSLTVELMHRYPQLASVGPQGVRVLEASPEGTEEERQEAPVES